MYPYHLQCPALHTGTLAGEPIWQGCSRRSSEDVFSSPRTRCPSCRELCPWKHTADRAVQTQFPTHTALCWFILDIFQLSGGKIGGIFLQSHLTTESILKACRCLIPSSPTENPLLWRALGIRTAPCLRHPKRDICKGMGSHLWNYFSCLSSGKEAVSCCTLSVRAFYRMPFRYCGCALQVYSERPHAQGKLWATWAPRQGNSDRLN